MYRAKEAAKEEISGSVEDSFKLLRSYLATLEDQDGFNCSTLDRTHDGKFRRVFISFGACIQAFASCRLLVGLDGTHLKGHYLGTLLCATCVDANNQLFILAFAVVDAENATNWKWFLNRLKSSLIFHFGEHNVMSQTLTFLSDRQKGLIDGVEEVFGDNCYHGFCLRHLIDNLK